MILVMRLMLLLLLKVGGAQQTESNVQFKTSSKATTSSQGLSLEGPSTYYSLSGSNGLKLAMSLPAKLQYDYTIMFWFRCHQDLATMAVERAGTKAVLLDLPGCVTCYVENGLKLSCQAQDQAVTTQEIYLANLPDVQTWIHFTYVARQGDSSTLTPGTNANSTLRLDFGEQYIEANGVYKPLNSSSVYLGLDKKLTTGFDGDIREFFASYGAINKDSITNLLYMEKVFDISTMAHYRFGADGNFLLNDNFRNQKGVTIGVTTAPDTVRSLPILEYNDGTYPFCSTLTEWISVPHLTNKFTLPEVDVPVYAFAQDKFAYALSMWVFNTGEQTFSTSSLEGREKHQFFKLGDSFALWFDSPTSFRVYIYALKNFHEQSTQSVFLPLNQWANIQVSVSSDLGVTIMIFNTNGERQQTVVLSKFLKEQRPNGKLTVFENFSGYVKNLTLWETAVQIPIDVGIVKNFDASMVAQYEFTKENFKNGAWTTLLTSKGKDLPTNSTPIFEPKRYPGKVNFGRPSSMGQLEATSNLWDGVGCPNPKKALYKFSGKASVSVQKTLPKVTEASVEFWVRLTDTPEDPLYLFSLTETKTSRETMAVYIQNGVLKCAPFGQEEEVLSYEALPIDSWVHVSCGFKSGLFIQGHTFQAGTISAKKFSKTLSSSKSLIEEGSYRVTLANSGNLDQFVKAFFKDLRLWSEFRTVQDLKEYRFRQVPTSPGLEVNFKLLNGNEKIYNEADLEAVKLPIAEAKGYTFQDDLGDLIICASDRFWVAGKCTAFPYQNNILLSYFTINTELHGHQAVLTSAFTRSKITPLPYKQPLLNFNWFSSDTQLDDLYIKEQRNEDYVVLDPIFLGESKPYALTLIVSDAENHSFYQKIEQTLQPRKCLLVVDSATRSPLQYKTLTRGEKDPICFEFQVDRVPGCTANIYDVLQPNLQIQTQPALSSEWTNSATIEFKDPGFKVCYSNRTELLTDQPIDFVFTVSWKSKTDVTLPTAYMDIAYIIKVVDPVTAVLKASGDQIDIFQSLLLDASDSFFKLSGSKNGLSYKWICPDVFAAYCEKWDGSPLLEITQTVFQESGAVIEVLYDFTVEVSNAFTEEAPEQIFTANKTVVWKSLNSPQFTLKAEAADGSNRILVSQESKILIAIQNYNLNDWKLKFGWKLSPDAQGVSLSTTKGGLVIAPNSLKFKTAYTLSMTISNTQNDKAITTVVFPFTTGTAPYGGTFSILPSKGQIFGTDFSISLSNWKTDAPPATVSLFGIAKKSDSSAGASFDLLGAPVKFNSTISWTFKLPKMVAIQVVLTDLSGETVTQTQDVNVTEHATASWSEIVQQVFKQPDIVLKYQFLTFSAQQATDDGLSGFSKPDEVKSASLLTANEIHKDLLTLDPLNTNETTRSAVQHMVQVMLNLSPNTTLVSVEAALLMKSNLEIIQTLKGSYSYLVQQEKFRAKFVATLANLIDVGATPVSQRRMLQETTVVDQKGLLRSLLVVKNKFLDSMCDADSLEVVNAKMELRTRKVLMTENLTSLTFENFIGNARVQVPVVELLAKTSKFNPTATFICLQASFLKQNPVANYIFPNQVPEGKWFIQIDTIDSTKKRLEAFSGVKGSFSISFPYDYPKTTFDPNRTICMSFNGNLLDYSSSSWSQNTCETVYQKDKSILQCNCLEMHNFYHGVINDKARLHVDDLKVIFVEDVYNKHLLLGLLIPLVLMACCLPCFVVWLDKKDYEAIENDTYKVEDWVIVAFRKDCKEIKCNQEIFYNLKAIESYTKLNDFSRLNLQVFSVFMRQMMPITSLFYHFDFSEKRLTRLANLTFQIDTITILIIALIKFWGVFRSKLENSIHKADPEFEVTEIALYWICVTIIGFLTLPWPGIILKMFRTELTVKEKPKSKKKDKSSTIAPETDPGNYVLDGENIVGVQHHCFCLRTIGYALTTLLHLALIVYVAFVYHMNEYDLEGKSTYAPDWLNLSIEQTGNIILVWYVFMLVFGFIILNIIRILVISCIVPRKAVRMIAAEEHKSGCCDNCWRFDCCCRLLLYPHKAYLMAYHANKIIRIVKLGRENYEKKYGILNMSSIAHLNTDHSAVDQKDLTDGFEGDQNQSDVMLESKTTKGVNGVEILRKDSPDEENFGKMMAPFRQKSVRFGDEQTPSGDLKESDLDQPPPQILKRSGSRSPEKKEKKEKKHKRHKHKKHRKSKSNEKSADL